MLPRLVVATMGAGKPCADSYEGAMKAAVDELTELIVPVKLLADPLLTSDTNRGAVESKPAGGGLVRKTGPIVGVELFRLVYVVRLVDGIPWWVPTVLPWRFILEISTEPNFGSYPASCDQARYRCADSERDP
jgi:hypothetical protein